MKKVWGFAKRESVLCIAFLAAAVSMFFTPPSEKYIDYIDFSVLATLFCLMVTVQGFGKTGLFDFLSKKLSGRFSGSRTLSAALAAMCFFSAMLITNDVALLTFVPLTITLFAGRDKILIRCIILETAAANLGSMATPIGNPQNLFIYSNYKYEIGDFFAQMLPITGVALIIVLASIVFIPNEKIGYSAKGTKVSFAFSRNFFVYAAVFAVCVLSVARIIDYRICLGITTAAALIFDIKILAKPDYALLGTFVCFFVFVGNISAIPSVSDFVSGILGGRELFVSAALSQVISNVPAAIMLAGFTQNSRGLLMGVNIGGMGTLIASLASLISFKLYSRSEGAKKGRFFAEFSAYNFAVLGILLGVMCLIG